MVDIEHTTPLNIPYISGFVSRVGCKEGSETCTAAYITVYRYEE